MGVYVLPYKRSQKCPILVGNQIIYMDETTMPVTEEVVMAPETVEETSAPTEETPVAPTE